jgi:nicotinamide-nucleotide amidase
MPRIEEQARVVGRALLARQLTVVTAESCTAGWIAKALTDVPGSSSWFDAGWVTYGDDAKVDLLGVSPQTLARFGAVSQETVTEMAVGALVRWEKASVSMAVSGIAGPGGGTAEKPVGFVWFAWGDRRSGEIVVQSDVMHFAGDREAIRAASVFHALEGIAARL